MAGYVAEPEDARRGHVAPNPRDHEEARADREIADAERASALGAADERQRAGIERIAIARTPEERRRLWLAGEQGSAVERGGRG